MEYNFTHIDNIEYFVADNITEYVNSTKPFEYKKYVKYYKDAGYDEGTAKKLAENIPTNSVIEVYLLNRFKSLLENREKQELFDKRLDEVNKPNVTEIKKEIKRIAAEFVLNCKDVEKYYYNRATQRIECEWIKSRSKYKKKCLERLLKYNEYLEKPLTDSEMKYIEKELERGIVESIELSLKGGFKPVLYDVNTGVNRGTKRSNEGDAAQFLFVARAVLAGFSCSNVDVRTSPYDAVIDYNTYLLRVQVKGIDHDSIPFVSSPRGGAGADTSAPSNKSKEITRDACDLYVAVEKCDGTCYIIPIGDVEAYLREGKKSLPKTDKDKYKERWDLVEKEARNRFKYDV